MEETMRRAEYEIKENGKTEKGRRLNMGVKVLKRGKSKIQLEINGKFSLKDILNALDFCEIDELLSKKGLDEDDVQRLSEEINEEWWKKNKEWFLKG